MTREKAIEILKRKTTIPNDGEDFDDISDAFDMAIKALEQEPFINKPCVSKKVCEHDKQMVLDKIRAEIEQFAKNPNFGDLSTGASCGALKAIEIIDKYKAERSDKE